MHTTSFYDSTTLRWGSSRRLLALARAFVSLNTHAAAAIIQQCGTFTLTGACNVAANASCCPTEHVLLNSGRQSIVECYRRVCTNSNAPNLKSLLENHSLVHAFERASHPKLGRITSVMSGAYGMAAAVHLCTERIDVYGFSSLAAAAQQQQHAVSMQANAQRHAEVSLL